MNREREKQYRDLRKNFDRLAGKLLEEDYFQTGGDPCENDKRICREIRRRFRELQVERDMWRTGFIVSSISFSIILMMM